MAQGTINTPRETTIQRIATALENILNKIVDTSRASNIDYDNTESDLTADKVQGAIDELASEKADKSTTLAGYGITNAYTKAEVNNALNNNVETIASAIKQWDIGSYTIDLYGIGSPETYYTASSTYSGDKYLDVATGKMYDCLQTGPSTYTWHQAPVVLQLKSDINASAIEDIQEDISQSLSTTGNSLTIESAEANLVECVAEVEAVQEGSGDPSPTNIRPIIGQTEVVIDDCGKNLWDEQWELGSIDGTTGEPVSNSNIIRSKNFNRCDSGKTYYCKASSGANIHIYYYDAFKNYISKQDGFANNTVTTPSNTAYFKIIIFGTTYNNNVSVNYPSTDHDYHAYTGNTYRVEIGQKNKLPMTVDGIKSANTSGSWSGNVYTYNGVSFTVQTDEQGLVTGIKANGTSNNATYLDLVDTITAADSCVVSGCPATGGSNKYEIRLNVSTPVYEDTGNGIIIPKGTYIRPRILIFANITVSDILFRPMIRTAIDDSEFVPYNPNLPDAIYGGELDALTGEMRVDIVKIALKTLSYAGTTIGGLKWAEIEVTDSSKTTSDKISVVTSGGWTSTVPVIEIRDEHTIRVYGTVELFTTGDYAETEMIYASEPYTIQLTPQQIRLLKGTNHLSCNTGDLSIKYYPDNVLGQLKGDIESEYDERVATLETQMLGRPELKSITITNKLTSSDGVAVINELPKSIIVGAYLYNTSNNNTVIAIPYLASSGNLPFLKICSDSTTLSVLSGVSVSGIIYYFEI